MLGHVYFDLLADEDNGLLSIRFQLFRAAEVFGNLIWVRPVLDEQIWQIVALSEDV